MTKLGSKRRSATIKKQPRTNAEWSESTRVALLTAARKAFLKLGYDQASLDRIAADARLTKGAIYHHYRDKPGLFRAVFEQVQIELVAYIEQAAKKAETPFSGVYAGCEAFLDAILGTQMARILLLDGPRVLGWSTWRAIDYEIGGRSLQAGLEAAMKAGEIMRLDPNVLTTLINGALNEAALALSQAENVTRMRRATLVALQYLLNGLRQNKPT